MLYYFCDFHHTHEKEKNNQYFVPAFLLLIPSGILLFKNDFKLSFEFFFSQHHFGISIILNIARIRVEDTVVWLEWCRFLLRPGRQPGSAFEPHSNVGVQVWETQRHLFRGHTTRLWEESASSGAAAAAKNNVSTDYALS